MIRFDTTGYGKAALDTLAAAVGDLKAADPLRSVTILAPNNISAIVARRHLAHAKAVAAVEVTTLPRYAELHVAHLMTGRRPATGPITVAAWRAALAKNPGVFAETADHPQTLAALAHAHRELRDLSTDELAAVGSATPLSADVVRLHREVANSLAPDWYDETDLLAAAATALSTPAPTVLYLPQRLTRAEQAVLTRIAEITDLVVITALTGDAAADRVVTPGLEPLGFTPVEVATPPRASRIITASDSDDEVRRVVREVVGTLSNVPAHRVAVLYSSNRPYSRLLHEHLSAAGIAINGPGSRNSEERSVTRAFLDLLALSEQRLPRAALFQAISNAPLRDFTGARLPVARWERISRDAWVVSGDDWDVRLALHGKRREFDLDAATALSAFATTLLARFDDAATATTWADLSAWALELFVALVGDVEELTFLPPEEKYAATALVSAIQGLRSLDAAGTPASLVVLREVLAQQMASAVPRVGKFGEGVLVAPLSAAVGLDADVTFVVGLSEDLCPGRQHDDPLLPDRVRVRVTALPVLRDRVDEVHRHLLAAFASAPEVVATFPRGDLRRTTGRLPSRWLLPTLRLLTDRADLAATEWESAPSVDTVQHARSYAEQLLHTNVLATAQEWRTRAAAAGVLSDAVTDLGIVVIEERASEAFTRFDGNLAGASGLPDYAAGLESISASGLEKFAGCPHTFFVERLLGVRPIENPEELVRIKPSDLGTFLHQCMEELVLAATDEATTPAAGAPWTEAHRARLVQIATAKATAYELQGLTGHPRLWGEDRQRLIATLHAMLDADDAWRAANGAGIWKAELGFGKSNPAPDVEVPIPGGTVRMNGSADRVDVADGRIFVIDIKSGKPDEYKKISQDDPTVGGTKLQLPVYAYAARAAHRDHTGTTLPVTAAYWFVHRSSGRVELEMTEAVGTGYATALRAITSAIKDGLFPSRPPANDDYIWVQCANCNPDGLGYRTRAKWGAIADLPELADVTYPLGTPGGTDD